MKILPLILKYIEYECSKQKRKYYIWNTVLGANYSKWSIMISINKNNENYHRKPNKLEPKDVKIQIKSRSFQGFVSLTEKSLCSYSLC